MKKCFFSKLFVALVCLFSVSSCTSGSVKNYVGITKRSGSVGSVTYFYIDSFAMELKKGTLSVTISTFVYPTEQDQSSCVGRRLISRRGVYAVASSTGEGSSMVVKLDVPLADSVVIEQTGQGFSEFVVSNSTDLIFVDTSNWTSSMGNYGFTSPEQIRYCFGHACEIGVSSSPDNSEAGDFLISEFPPLFVGLD